LPAIVAWVPFDPAAQSFLLADHDRHFRALIRRARSPIDPVTGQVLWGSAAGGHRAGVALLSLVLGAITRRDRLATRGHTGCGVGGRSR